MGKVFAFGAASAQAARVDAVFLMILVIGVFFFFLTQGILIYFAVKYRRRLPDRDNETPAITGNPLLEFLWILIPSIVVVVIFYYGWRVYTDQRIPVAGATEVYVNARQWLYEIKYPDGRTAINEIRVPAGKPVKFILSASDVIHGFYLPDFRVKMDMIPGRVTTLWVQPDRPGRYQIYCTVYCGTGHSNMLAQLIVMPPDEYAAVGFPWGRGGRRGEGARAPRRPGRAGREERGVPQLPRDRGGGEDRPRLERVVRIERSPRGREDRDGRRGVSAGVDRGPGRQGREGVPQRDAHVQDNAVERGHRRGGGIPEDASSEAVRGVERVAEESGSGRGYLAERGWRSWAYTMDHKRIGVMYLYTTIAFFFIGGIFALLLRLELLSPQAKYFSDHTYNVFFTLHGAMMIFLFIIPAIPSGLGNFFIPMHIGARDVAFPRINLASYWVFVAGFLVVIGSLVSPMDTGWTFYTPYSAKTGAAVATLSFGIFLIGMSSILTGLNFIVTIHKLRAPGMTWHRLPLFIWGMYATSIIQVVATPVVGVTFLLLAMERLFGVAFFDPAKGGDPVLFQHFFWFYSHPVVYVMILPAMGIISEVIPVFSRKPIFGYKRDRLLLAGDRVPRVPGVGAPHVHLGDVPARQRRSSPS